MTIFNIIPTASKRKLTKQVMKAIEKELAECSPHYELTIDIKIIENQSKPIPEITSKRKWKKLFEKLGIDTKQAKKVFRCK